MTTIIFIIIYAVIAYGIYQGFKKKDQLEFSFNVLAIMIVMIAHLNIYLFNDIKVIEHKIVIECVGDSVITKDSSVIFKDFKLSRPKPMIIR